MAWHDTRLDSEKEKDDIVSVRLNPEERKMVDHLKKVLNVKADATALKIGATVGKNVIHTMFGDKISKYLFKKERSKYEE